MNNWDTMQTKRIIFDLYDTIRILWNDYYNTNRNFNEDDINTMKKLKELLECKVIELEDELKCFTKE